MHVNNKRYESNFLFSNKCQKNQLGSQLSVIPSAKNFNPFLSHNKSVKSHWFIISCWWPNNYCWKGCRKIEEIFWITNMTLHSFSIALQSLQFLYLQQYGAGLDQDQLKARGYLSKSISCLSVKNNVVLFSITVPLWWETL